MTFLSVLLAQAADVPEPTILNVALQAGAMGLLGLIVILIFKHAPQLIHAHREGLTALSAGHAAMAKEARDQLDRVADSIREDRHADRNLTHQQLLEFRLETKELRDTFTKLAADQRIHDDAKTEKLMSAIREQMTAINEQKSAMVEALHKIDDSHRLLAEAIREKHPRARDIGKAPPAG